MSNSTHLPWSLGSACTSNSLSQVHDEYVAHIEANPSMPLNSTLSHMATLAARSHSASVLEFCFKEGLVLDPDHINEPVLYAATDGRSPEVYRVMLRYGWDANQRLELQGDALVSACRDGDREVVKVLVEAGANVNSGRRWDRRTGMEWALVGNHKNLEVVRLLLEAGFEIRGTGVLGLVAEWGSVEFARILIEYGADTEELRCSVEGVEGTALWKAAKRGAADICVALIQAGARRDWRDGNGKSSVDIAREKGHEEVVVLLEGLLENGD